MILRSCFWGPLWKANSLKHTNDPGCISGKGVQPVSSSIWERAGPQEETGAPGKPLILRLQHTGRSSGLIAHKADLELTAATISGSGHCHERNLTHWDPFHSLVGFNAFTLLLHSRTVLFSLEHLLCYDPSTACTGDSVMTHVIQSLPQRSEEVSRLAPS